MLGLSAISPVYAEPEANVAAVEVVESKTLAETEFINGIKAEKSHVYITDMNKDNLWTMMDQLLYSYYPEAYYQDWSYETVEGKPIVRLGLLNKEKYCFIFGNEFYKRITDPNSNAEYYQLIDQIINESGLTADMSNKSKITCLVKQIGKYHYDAPTYEKLIFSGVPGWKIVRDHGISICHSDSKLLMACLDRLGIENRLVENTEHAWNQVLVEGQWLGVDVSYARKARVPSNYIYFNDAKRPITITID